MERYGVENRKNFLRPLSPFGGGLELNLINKGLKSLVGLHVLEFAVEWQEGRTSGMQGLQSGVPLSVTRPVLSVPT